MRRERDGWRIILREGTQTTPLPASAEGIFRLRVDVSDDGTCRFHHAAKTGSYTPCEQVFQAQPGVWIGTKVGLYTTADRPISPCRL